MVKCNRFIKYIYLFRASSSGFRVFEVSGFLLSHSFHSFSTHAFIDFSYLTAVAASQLVQAPQLIHQCTTCQYMLSQLSHQSCSSLLLQPLLYFCMICSLTIMLDITI